MRRSEMLDIIVSKWQTLAGRRMDTPDFEQELASLLLDAVEEAGMLPPKTRVFPEGRRIDKEYFEWKWEDEYDG